MAPSVAHLAAPGGQGRPARFSRLQLSRSHPGHKKQKLAHPPDGQDRNLTPRVDNLTHNTTQGFAGDESASKWFDQANQNVPTAQETSPPTEDDPPFFLSSPQTGFPNNVASSGSDDFFGPDHPDHGENEELRSVIDDLTVENKRLKRLLRTQRPPASPTPEAKDRLFELRVHGLSAEKKRELEMLLRKFTNHANTSSLSRSSSSTTSGSGNISGNTGSDPANWNTPVPQAAKFHQEDSGYDTKSHSGTNSAAATSGGKSSLPVSTSSRNKSIKNYLHDIPNSLLPRQSPFMNEQAKQVLVVGRLEQLFTGKVAAPGEHSQPIQQQELSHSAAKADARTGRTGKVEGSREAHILPHDTKVNLDSADRQDASLHKLHYLNIADSDNSESSTVRSTPVSPDQRPTRPLDLDIHRAQVASDNIEYIRHLGLSTPHSHSGNENGNSSWIYLSLLVSMAQLHTLNVTPSFIREAIKKLSTKFELSQDGKQVRWKGGTDGTMFANEVGRVIESVEHNPTEAVEEKSQGSCQESKTNSSSNALLSEEPSSEGKTSGLHTTTTSKQEESACTTSNVPNSSFDVTSISKSAFDCKPVVFKGMKYSATTSYLESTSSSSPSRESGELVRLLRKSNLSRRRRSDEGIITFFRNSYFCSDASADKSPINWKRQRAIMPWEGVGVEQEPLSESPLRHHNACYFTPQFAEKSYHGRFEEVDLSPLKDPIAAAGEKETQPLELEASGIGGVWPEDNFAVDLKVIREAQDPRNDANPHVVPLTGSRKGKRYSYRTAKCDVRELQPSKLPPPSYIFFTSSSASGNAEMGGFDWDTSSSADEDYPAPAPLLNQWSTGSSDVEYEEEDDDFASGDLLELAPAADPDRVATQEREYLLNRSERVEGSVAATAGASDSSSSVGQAELDSQDGLTDMSTDGDDE